MLVEFGDFEPILVSFFLEFGPCETTTTGGRAEKSRGVRICSNERVTRDV
jgi:hypothetical protein